MNNLSINHSIQELLNELQSLIERLKNDSGNTSQLELDLMKEKIRDIYENLSDVKINKSVEKQKEAETITEPQPNSTQEEKPTPEVVPGFILDVEEGEHSEVETETSDPGDKNEQDEPLSQPEHILNLFEEPLNDNDNKSIAEKIAEEKPAESIGEAIQSKKIVNLKLAIGINEKFFFLNELFEGNMKEYNEAIDVLDQKVTFKDAMGYIVLLQEKKNWDEKSEAYIQLKEFLERKFN